MRHLLETRAPDGRSVTLRPLKPLDAPRVQEACADRGELTYDLLATDPR